MSTANARRGDLGCELRKALAAGELDVVLAAQPADTSEFRKLLRLIYGDAIGGSTTDSIIAATDFGHSLGASLGIRLAELEWPPERAQLDELFADWRAMGDVLIFLAERLGKRDHPAPIGSIAQALAQPVDPEEC